MVDRLIERLGSNSIERSNLDSLDSFINLTRAIFSKSKVNERHVDYFKEKIRMNMTDTDYVVSPKQISNILGNILTTIKGDLFTNKIGDIVNKQSQFIDKTINEDKKVCFIYIQFL